MKFKTKLLYFSFIFFLLLFIFHLNKYEDSPENRINFESFDNVSGVKSIIVPNYIHYINFDKKTISFIPFICVCSAFFNQNPSSIFFHSNVKLQGKYYNILKKLLGPTLKVQNIEKPSHVFGKKLTAPQNAKDVARIKILMKYGGIYLDQDVFVVRSLNRFRHFEATVSWPRGGRVSSGVLAAHRHARLLARLMEALHDLAPAEAEMETILRTRPELVHRVVTGMESGPERALQTEQQRWVGWAKMFTIALAPELTESSYPGCGCAAGDMIQSVVTSLQLEGVTLGGDNSTALSGDEKKIREFMSGDSKSLLHKYLTPDTYDGLKHLKTESYGSSLMDVVRSGLAHPDSSLGVYAPDLETYTVFRKLMDPVIRDYHQVKGRLQQPASNWEIGQSKIGNFSGDFVKSTRIRIARNLEGYPLNSKMSKDDYLRLEREVSTALESLGGDLAGSYLALAEMSPVEQERLVAAHLMFRECDEYLRDGGACQHWPHGRGIFLSRDRKFVVWVGEEDHLRIISIEPGGDLASVFRRLGRALASLETKLQFARLPSLGYVTYCPSNLGTTLRASVHISLPGLAGADLARRAAALGLQVRGAGGEHTEKGAGAADLSNLRRLGVSEAELVAGLYTAITSLIRDTEATRKP